MIETVKMFDYWAFHDDGQVQFFQVCQGKVIDYRHYDKVEDAPIALIGEGPELRYHGAVLIIWRAYLAPVGKP